jgi:hypothetical protein
MANDTSDYIERIEVAHEAGCWIMKHVPAQERRVGDAQINDQRTNALIILRRITPDEAKQMVLAHTSDDAPLNESLGIVILPIESKIVQAIKRQKKHGNQTPVGE